MKKKSFENNGDMAQMKQLSPIRNILMMLSLFPLIIGVIFIGAWVFDIYLLKNLNSQVTLGIGMGHIGNFGYCRISLAQRFGASSKDNIRFARFSYSWIRIL